ncbi:MAG: M1 family aminopeptidase [Pyrinomonadaceae bacterium]
MRRQNESAGGARRAARLCVVGLICLLALCFCIARAQTASAQTSSAAAPHLRYQLNLALDFDARTYTGTERVRWVNRDSKPTSVVYFHLYANLRGDAAPHPNQPNSDESAPAVTADEPRLEIAAVRAGDGQTPLPFTLDEQATLLRVNLREAVPAGGSTELELAFNGSVPEIDADETSLPAHVVQQLGAALRDTRETRRARDLNFRSRGVMLLGMAYPVLAVRDGNDWQRDVKPSVGDLLFTEVADYEVTIGASTDVKLFTSGEFRTTTFHPVFLPRDKPTFGENHFTGANLRNFAILAGRGLKADERTVEGVRVRSIWTMEHEKVGRRALDVATAAVRLFNARYGPLPYESVSVVEAPLVAGLGSAEFANMSVIASAFYVDFDAPAMRNLPELVREQRASVEDSLEFAVAHMIAHQWWGMVVGSSPERTPVLDEALAHWSALVYYRETKGPERATQARDDQLRGVYEVYRTFGGDDMAADHAARDYRNSFQYAAIVSAKGALMFEALEKLLGSERVFTALRRYGEANRFEVAELDDLRGAFVAEAPIERRRAVTRLFDRWLSEKHGDEDIAPPNPQLAAALGIATEQSGPKDRNAFSRLGRFFWRQMTRIR